jgi:hypothetical protein
MEENLCSLVSFDYYVRKRERARKGEREGEGER